jgi:hypothetical protein
MAKVLFHCASVISVKDTSAVGKTPWFAISVSTGFPHAVLVRSYKDWTDSSAVQSPWSRSTREDPYLRTNAKRNKNKTKSVKGGVDRERTPAPELEAMMMAGTFF